MKTIRLKPQITQIYQIQPQKTVKPAGSPQDAVVKNFVALMARLHHVDAGRKFSREEMNER